MKLLLHICCGPCGIWVANKLSDQYQVTLFFYNPNIWPEEEFEKRYNVLIPARHRLAPKALAGGHWNKQAGFDLIKGQYNHDEWLKAIKGMENEPEGGARCSLCFKFRLVEIARYAKDHGFDCLATTLTSGRNKKAEIINPLGQNIAKEYGLVFVAGDWKKAGGQEASHKLSEELGLYRQHYCGCEFSLKF